mgnify:CR=1 FL=1
MACKTIWQSKASLLARRLVHTPSYGTAKTLVLHKIGLANVVISPTALPGTCARCMHGLSSAARYGSSHLSPINPSRVHLQCTRHDTSRHHTSHYRKEAGCERLVQPEGQSRDVEQEAGELGWWHVSGHGHCVETQPTANGVHRVG